MNSFRVQDERWVVIKSGGCFVAIPERYAERVVGFMRMLGIQLTTESLPR